MSDKKKPSQEKPSDDQLEQNTELDDINDKEQDDEERDEYGFTAKELAEAHAKLGRPLLINEQWVDENIDTVLTIFKSGGSIAQVCSNLNISRGSYNKAKAISKTFLLATLIGRQHSEAFWDELGRRGAMGKIKNFNAHAFKHMTANLFSRADNLKLTTSGDIRKIADDMSPELATEIYMQSLRSDEEEGY